MENYREKTDVVSHALFTQSTKNEHRRKKNADNKIDVFVIRRGSFIVIFNQKGANSIHHNAYTLSQAEKKADRKNTDKNTFMPERMDVRRHTHTKCELNSISIGTRVR